MSNLVTCAAVLAVVLECAILLQILWGRVALPCFATFLVADATFSVAMVAVSLSSGGWLTVRYDAAYHVAAPFVLALLVLAAVEAIGAIPWPAAVSLASMVIATTSVSAGAAVTHLAIMSAVAVALVVSLTDRRPLHAVLLLAYVLANVVAVLSIAMGESGIRPALFQSLAQLVPLVGWCVWIDSHSVATSLSAPAFHRTLR